MKRPLQIVLLGLLISLCPALVLGQSGNASITGTVHDASGAVVPAAEVRVADTATGVVRATVTNPAGVYLLQNLIPGTYKLEVQAAGFQGKQISDIHLVVDQQARLDVEIQVGAVSQAVIVTSAPPLLQVEEASVGTVVQSRQVQNLPLNGRYFTQLLQLAPGSAPSIRTPGYNSADPALAGRQRNGMTVFDMNGQSGALTYFRIDGIENTEREFGGANIPVSVDAIQEFKLQTANFSAEYGRSAVQVDVVTRSGGNQVHGVLFEFLRNKATAAPQWSFTGPHTKSDLKRNQFGGSVGGPIRRDKLFYFFNYDGTRSILSSPRVLTVPSNDMRNGVFPSGEIIFDPLTQRPFPNNQIPQQRFDPITSKVLPVVPAANLPGQPVTNTAGFQLARINNYFFNPQRRQTIDQFNVRLDYSRSTKDNFAFRYTGSSNDILGQGPLATNIQGSLVGFERAHLGGKNMSASWYHNFSATLLNEFRFGFLTNPQNYAKGDTKDYASEFGLKQFLYPNAFTGLPHFRIGSIDLSSGDYRPLQVSDRNLQYVDNLTVVRGVHTLRIGADVRKAYLQSANGNVSSGQFYFNGAQTRDRNFPTAPTTFCPGGTDARGCSAGDAAADFLLGYLNRALKGTPIRPVPKRFANWAGFVNDTWHLRRNLTLTLGLRYEFYSRLHSDSLFYSAPVLKNGDFSGVVAVSNDSKGNISPLVLQDALAQIPGVVTTCRQAGLPDNCLFSQKDLWQPRFGFAWSVNKKTVVRGAFGIFYGFLIGMSDTEEGENWPLVFFNQTPNFTRPPSGTAAPPLLMSNPFQGGTPAVPLFGYSGAPNRRIPSTYQWNFTIERSLTPDTTLAVGYVANVSRHLENNAYNRGYCCWYNVPQPWGVVLAPGQQQVRADPRFSDIVNFQDQDTASYQSLQAKLERRFSHGLTFTSAYTYSKNLYIQSWLSDPRNPKLDRGPWGNDLTHNFVLSSVWQVPVGAGRHFLNVKGPLNQVLGGWQLSAIVTKRSGFAFTPTLSGVDLLNLNGLNGQNRPDRVCNGTISDPTVFRWFDKNCFTMPVEPTTPGALLRGGNSGYNILRGPGAFGTDMGLSKTFPFSERLGLDFRAEFFNVFNHPVFGMPNSVINPANNPPAQITSTSSEPRIIQFALKLHF